MNAVIYCRVSTKEQVKGYSLKDQEQQCRDFAKRNGLCVIECFIEQGESAKTADRLELQKLLKYVTANKKEVDVVVVYKIDRLSRNMYDTSQLMLLLQQLGVSLKSATEQVDDTPVGQLTVNVLGSVAQFENDVRSERTISGMIQALKDGRWVSTAPMGYKFSKDSEEKSRLVPSKDAHYISEAFALYKTGLYKQTDVLQKLQEKGFDRIEKQNLNYILRNPLYAGILKHSFLEEPLEGTHEPLVSKQDFHTVQAILDGKRPNITPRQRYHPDFPLRGFVECPYCHKPLTGSWSTGRNQRYAYYHCRTKDCQFKGIRKEKFEQQFVALLEKIQPESSIIELFARIIEDVYKEKMANQKQERNKVQKQLIASEQKKQRIFDLLLDDAIDKTMFQEQKEKIENEIREKGTKLDDLSTNPDDAYHCINYCHHALKNLPKLWVDGDIKVRQRFQQIIFPENISFNGEFIGTEEMSRLFNVLADKNANESNLAPRVGLEPTTLRLQLP